MIGAAHLSEQATDAKQEATLMAALALRGFVVHRVTSGYLVANPSHGQSRHCGDLQALASFARAVGAIR